MNITYNSNLSPNLATTVSTANNSIDKLNQLIKQADEQEKLYQLSVAMKGALDALLTDLKSIENDIRQLEYTRYCNSNQYGLLNDLAFIKKARLKKECKELTKDIHALRRERADKNEKYLKTEEKLKELLERVSTFDFPALVNEYRLEVLTKLNPCIQAIGQETGLNINYANPYLDISDLPTAPIKKFKLVQESTSSTNTDEME